MTILIAILLFILAISILVLFHEFGHFITAKIFGMRAEKFYLFMNPGFCLMRMKRINGKFKIKFFTKNTKRAQRNVFDENGDPLLDDKGKIITEDIPIEELPNDDWCKYPENTEYGIGWLPIGGFVKIVGMVDESLDTKNLKKDPEPWEYRAKPAWQRFIVITAGVIMNLIIGVMIFSFTHLIFTKKYVPISNVTEGIYAYPYGQYVGFQNGDIIIKLNDEKVERKEDIVNNGIITTNLVFAKTATVLRDGKEKVIEIPDTLFNVYKNNVPFIGFDNIPLKILDVLPYTLAKSPNNNSVFDTIRTGAYLAGLDSNTTILAVQNEEIVNFGQFKEILYFNKGKNIPFIIKKNNVIDTVEVSVDTLGRIGILSKTPDYELADYNILSSIKFGWKDAIESMNANIKGFGKIFSGQMSASESLSGPLGILLIFKKGIIENDGNIMVVWSFFWKLTAIFSMALAFMNIIPIPALDGGHALFVLIEAITRKKLSDKFLIYSQYVGLALLLILMIYATGNDILKIFR